MEKPCTQPEGFVGDGVLFIVGRHHLEFGTWYFGLPASSSHTLIGAILGVGVANALMEGQSFSRV